MVLEPELYWRIMRCVKHIAYLVSAEREVRSVTIDRCPWFVAADVCEALEIGNPSDVTSRLESDEYTLVLIEGVGKGSPVNCVNEPGLYSLILGSRKPEATAFKR